MAVSPFTILVDTKEKDPWQFSAVPGHRGEGILTVPREWHSLGSGYGDYTIKGANSKSTKWRIVIERKSLDDLFSTILSRRRQFEVELENLSKMEYAAVVTEADLSTVLNYRPHYWGECEMDLATQLKKHRQIVGSIQAWQLRYPVIRWWFLPREYAEIWVYRLFDRFWRDHIHEQRPKQVGSVRAILG